MKRLKEKHMVKKARQSKNWDVRQAELKTGLNLQENEDIVVVEKSNMIKFLIITSTAFIRLMATIIILVFSILGMAAFVYPEPRAEMLKIMEQLFYQLVGYF